MDRRRMLRDGVAAGLVATAGGGLLFARRAHARSALTASLLDDALPCLADAAGRELADLPARAREEVKRYFLGKCLNVDGFVSHVCTDGFRERLGRCTTDAAREALFLQAFCSRVATEAEILNRVEMVAAEVGAELDSAWANYCLGLSGRWNARFAGSGPPLDAGGLADGLTAALRADLQAAAAAGAAAGQAPAVGPTIGAIGRSAVLLLPLAHFGPAGLAVGVPVFVVLAARAVWDYAWGRLADGRADARAAVSGRLAVLGHRVGAEFEREVRGRITDLHTWREKAVRADAVRLVDERVGIF